MSGFILECLAGRSWRRDGITFWTQADAKRKAEHLLRRGKATAVRVLQVEVSDKAVAVLNGDESDG